MPRESKYTYSETFYSIQGEGRYCGVPTVWLRLFGCNFRCSGFLQDNLDDPSTWVLDFEDLDPSRYTSLQDLPVFKRGCDSSYSWAKKFSPMAQIAERDSPGNCCVVAAFRLLLAKGRH